MGKVLLLVWPWTRSEHICRRLNLKWTLRPTLKWRLLELVCNLNYYKIEANYQTFPHLESFHHNICSKNCDAINSELVVAILLWLKEEYCDESMRGRFTPRNVIYTVQLWKKKSKRMLCMTCKTYFKNHQTRKAIQEMIWKEKSKRHVWYVKRKGEKQKVYVMCPAATWLVCGMWYVVCVICEKKKKSKSKKIIQEKQNVWYVRQPPGPLLTPLADWAHYWQYIYIVQVSHIS